MEHSCHKCGKPVEDGVPFCSQCGAPQIRVATAEPQSAFEPMSRTAHAQGPAYREEPKSALGLAAPSTAIRWAQGLPAAAVAGLVAGLGMTLIGLFGLWMMAAGFLSVVFYRRRTHGDTLLPGAGARLGALSGSLGFALFALITVPTGFFRAMMLEMVQKYSQRSDPQVRALTETWLELLKTPSGLTAWLISLFFLMVVASAIGGALGGAFLSRRGRT